MGVGGWTSEARAVPQHHYNNWEEQRQCDVHSFHAFSISIELPPKTLQGTMLIPPVPPLMVRVMVKGPYSIWPNFEKPAFSCNIYLNFSSVQNKPIYLTVIMFGVTFSTASWATAGLVVWEFGVFQLPGIS